MPLNSHIRPLPRLQLPPPSGGGVAPFQPVTSPLSLTSSPPPKTSCLLSSRTSDTPSQHRLKADDSIGRVSLPNLADHMDMARPPHENPEYLVQTGFKTGRPVQEQYQPTVPYNSTVQTVQAAIPIAIPVTNFTFSASASSPSVTKFPKLTNIVTRMGTFDIVFRLLYTT